MFFVSALCSVYDNIKDEPTENHTEKSDSNSGSQKEWQNNKKINNNQKKKRVIVSFKNHAKWLQQFNAF